MGNEHFKDPITISNYPEPFFTRSNNNEEYKIEVTKRNQDKTVKRVRITNFTMEGYLNLPWENCRDYNYALHILSISVHKFDETAEWLKNIIERARDRKITLTTKILNEATNKIDKLRGCLCDSIKELILKSICRGTISKHISINNSLTVNREIIEDIKRNERQLYASHICERMEDQLQDWYDTRTLICDKYITQTGPRFRRFIAMVEEEERNGNLERFWQEKIKKDKT